MEIKENQKAINFTLPDQTGNTHSLSDYLGSWVLIYFYPKDDTPGCTKEACEIRDNFPDFEKLNINVLGISADNVNSHEKFATKHNLPFTLLSDQNKEVIKKYNVWKLKKFMGKEYMGIVRSSFLIDPKGNIAKIYKKVKPKEHALQVLNDVKELI